MAGRTGPAPLRAGRSLFFLSDSQGCGDYQGLWAPRNRRTWRNSKRLRASFGSIFWIRSWMACAPASRFNEPKWRRSGRNWLFPRSEVERGLHAFLWIEFATRVGLIGGPAAARASRSAFRIGWTPRWRPRAALGPMSLFWPIPKMAERPEALCASLFVRSRP